MVKWSALALPLALLADSRVKAQFQYTEDVFFIVAHQLLTATRLDSIMSPGGVSGHVHAIVGGSNFGPTYDYDDSIASECTSSNVAVDHSNYWTPQMYNKHADGTFSLAKLVGVSTYYLLRRPNGDEPVHEFPAGFRMLAGDQNRRTFDESDPAQNAINYLCLGTDVTTNSWPTTQCPNGVRAQVFFPHCWDGVNNWLEGSKHVTYGEGKGDSGGACPASHPKRLMSLFYEFVFEDKLGPGGRVWSNGDETGYGLHADFTNGWPVGLFTEIMSYGRECSVSGDLQRCPALAPHVQLQGQCAYKGVTVDEDIGDNGPIAKLPGNNPAMSGYQETAGFNTGSPAPVIINQVAAPAAILAPVGGDAPVTGVPDAVSQSGRATSAAASTGPGYGATSSAQAPVVDGGDSNGAPAQSTAAGVPATSAAAPIASEAAPTAPAQSDASTTRTGRRRPWRTRI